MARPPANPCLISWSGSNGWIFLPKEKEKAAVGNQEIRLRDLRLALSQIFLVSGRKPRLMKPTKDWPDGSTLRKEVRREGKVLRVLPSGRWLHPNQGLRQFLRDQASDSDEVVTPLMLDGTYLSRNFATLGPIFWQPPWEEAAKDWVS